MTRTPEENAADLAYDEKIRALADQTVAADPGRYVSDMYLEYEDWLEAAGLDADDLGDTDRPGSQDLYDAAMRAFEIAFGKHNPARN